jgi:hypothetical protein
MPKGRRARRVIRKIDTWSVLRLSLLFYLALLLTLLVAGAILWQVAATVGITDNLIKLIKKLGDFSSYKINGGVILKDAALAGLILAVFGAFLNALVCVLYNLISDVVGGIRVDMFDEEMPARRGRAAPRPAGRAAAPVPPPALSIEPSRAPATVALQVESAAAGAAGAAAAAGDGNGSVGDGKGSAGDGNGSAGDGNGSAGDGNGSGRTSSRRPNRPPRTKARQTS